MIVCDFEGTIYDEAKLRRDLRGVFGSFGLDFETIYRKCAKHGHFCLESLGQTNLKKSQKTKIARACRKLLQNGSGYVFADAKKFLRKYSGKVSILTYGSGEFQREKILGSGIAKYVKRIEITQLHKRESKDLFAKATAYIDNDLAIIKEIAELHTKMKLYLIDRDGKSNSTGGRIVKIRSLVEVKNVESRRVKAKKQKNRSKI